MPLTTLAAAILLQPSQINFTDGLGITVRGNARTPVRVDPVEAKMAEDPGYWPKLGETLDGQTWAKVSPGQDGRYSGRPFSGGYAAFEVVSATARPMLLEAVGNGMVYVNGEPRVGDVYSFGYVSIPVQVRAGTNRFLFAGGRGSMSAKLVDPPSPVSLDLRDATLPDILPEGGKALGGVVVRNCSPDWLKGATVETRSSDGVTSRAAVPAVPPFSNRKIPAEFALSGDGQFRIRVLSGAKELCGEDVTLRKTKRGEPYKVTFVSQVDGSVQYYGVNPPKREGPGNPLVLSLHGASVEALGQAQAYGQKETAYIVAATNRRPYGFDWEDIGRLDALEVLAHASARFDTDPSKTYLTGHSMGGHGTWQIGVHYPDKFAAIGPSAGWIAFSTYAGGARFDNPTPLEQLIVRAMSPSDTLALKTNYAQLAVYIVHGTADDNVPFAQATRMKEELTPFHKDIQWHDQPGAGHWWDESEEPGAGCVDWGPMFDTFARRRLPLPDGPREIDFSTSSPGVSASCHWVTVQQQEKQFATSRVQLKREPNLARVTGTTTNVGLMTLQNVSTLTLDGQTVALSDPGASVSVKKEAGKWIQVPALDPAQKNPARYGSFKDIFKNRVVFVYGTGGSQAENSWAFAKARYDAETLWVRGNGAVDILPDTEFRPADHKGRNVVLYGNRSTNSAYGRLVRSEFEVASGSLTAGAHQRHSDGNLGVCAVFPRRDDQSCSVAVVGGTGIHGMRLTDRVPFFTSGASMPDVLVFTPASLAQGTRGMLCAGFFGNDWTVANGDFAWQIQN